MQTEHGPWKTDEEEDCPSRPYGRDFTCSECGRTYRKPILATVSTCDQTRTYYACPRCMTKVQSIRPHVKERDEKAASLTEEPIDFASRPQDLGKCGHFFGYLSKHQKSTPFPDECLTCARMVECLLH